MKWLIIGGAIVVIVAVIVLLIGIGRSLSNGNMS
jgi:hypothetical protein